MKITEVRTRVVQWQGETVPLPPHFCTNPMDLVMFAKRPWATLRSWLGAGGDIHGRRPGGPWQCCAGAAGHQDLHRYLPEAAAHRGRPMGHRVPVAADVSANHGVRPQGRGDGGDQCGRYCAVGPAGEVGQTARLQVAGRTDQAAHPGVCEPVIRDADSGAARGGAEV